MANLKDYEKLTVSDAFSEDFKRKKVSELDRNLISVAALCREYQVSRAAFINGFMHIRPRKKGLKQVVEAKSDSQKLLAMRLSRLRNVAS